MSDLKAVVAGTIALDIVPAFPKDTCESAEILMEGKTIYIDDISLILGGCVSNTGVAMHRLGAPVTLCSKIGDDPLGDVVRRMLEKTGTKYALTRSTGKNSSATIVVTPEGKDRTFWHRRGASQEYCFEDIPQECLKDSALFHFGYPTGMECMYSDGGDTLQALFQGVKEMGLTTSLDLSLPGLTSASAKADWRAIMAKTLPYVDVFLPSIEELMFLLRRDTYLKVLEKAGMDYAIDYIDLEILDSLKEEILGFGVKVFGLKLGKNGIYLCTAGKERMREIGALRSVLSGEWYDRELLEPPFAVERLYSTNGAGDTAIAGFLTGMLKGWSPEHCLKLATGSAAFRIGSAEGADAIPDAKEVMERCVNREKIKLTRLPPSWQWSNSKQIYSR